LNAEDFRVAKARLNKSNAEMADLLGVHCNTTSRWARGDYPIPKIAALAIEKLLEEKEQRDIYEALQKSEGGI